MSERATRIPHVRVWVPALLLLCCLSTAHSESRLAAIRSGVRGDGARVVFDLSGALQCRLEPGENAAVWKVVLPGRCQDASAAKAPANRACLSGVEIGCEGKDLAIRLRTRVAVEARGFRLPAGDGKPERFVVDLTPLDPTSEDASGGPSDAGAIDPTGKGQEPAFPVVEEPAPRRSGKWRIAIDPGHGGADPGAKRPGIQEKEIVLDVARRVARILNATDDFDARLTRTDDRRIGLRQRFAFAEKFDADAFVSIHVNAAKRKDAFGVEVFFLSLGGASDEASRELALLENEADPEFVMEEDSLLQGIPFSFDLRQSDTLLRSSRLAESVLDSFESSRLAASRGVKQAGFAVLKSFQVPSILVEVGFLSNPAEAKRLKDEEHRGRLAACIADGTIQYFQRFARSKATAQEP